MFEPISTIGLAVDIRFLPVIPAKAGIQCLGFRWDEATEKSLDARFRWIHA
jgi:hypothetical protein